jgi:serine/threonine protein kinase
MSSLITYLYRQLWAQAFNLYRLISACGTVARQHTDIYCVVSAQADVYSFGVTLWESIERKRPWQGLDGMQLWTMWVSDPTNVKLPPLSIREAAGESQISVKVV